MATGGDISFRCHRGDTADCDKMSCNYTSRLVEYDFAMSKTILTIATNKMVTRSSS